MYRLSVSPLDGRVHGCLDSSAYVKGFTSTVSPIVKSQVEIGSYITHINDRFVVGCTFSAVLQLLRQEKRPLKIRFERGIDENDEYAYKGAKPVQSLLEAHKEDPVVDIYDTALQHLSNNVMINTATNQLVTMRLTLLSPSYSTLDNIKFLMRRRSSLPTFTNGEFVVSNSVVSAYPRKLIYKQLIDTIPSSLEEDTLGSLFDHMNTDYSNLFKRSTTHKDIQRYLESTSESFSTRELNGIIIITQKEMLLNVLFPLKEMLPNSTYQLILLYYVQSLLHAQISIQTDLYLFLPDLMYRSQHVRSHLIALGERGMASLLYLTRAGLIVQDVKNCQRQMIEEEGFPISVDIALKYLRQVHDYPSLLDYYNKKQQVFVWFFFHVVK